VVPDLELMVETDKVARELARGPRSLGLIRNLMWRSLDASFAEQVADEAATQTIAGKSEDFVEGVKAFLEKRQAVFTGR
jgi:2-(1,2-epoxy-1,2-dihydrophenyl)acetyl-CoA isomerase